MFAAASRAVAEPISLLIGGIPERHGEPSPLGYGEHFLDRDLEIATGVNSPADEANGEHYVCAGWQGLGSVPFEGTGSSVMFTLTTPSILNWLWTKEYLLSIDAEGGGTVNSNDVAGWHASGATVAGITATPDAERLFAGWTGDVSRASAFDNPLSLVMDQPRSIAARFVPLGPKLTVRSDWGSPVPGVGFIVAQSGDVVECSVDLDVVTNGMWARSTGWAGDGSVPASGSSNAFAFTIETDSTITWLWETNYWLESRAEGAGTVDGSNGWYAAFSSVTVTATVTNIHAHLVGWTGTVEGAVIQGDQITVTMDRPRFLAAVFAPVPCELTIASLYGSPVPPVGVYTGGYGQVITCRVETAVAVGGTQHVCVGWTGTGSAPPTGNTSEVVFTITNTSSVTWHWEDRYRLAAASAGGGTVNVEAVNGWYAIGTVVTGLTATPDKDWRFVNWTGDVPSGLESTNPLSLTMDRPRDVKAVFERLWETLTVTSDYGSPVPPVGAHVTNHNTVVECSVEAALTEGTTQHVCRGWVGSGSVPSAGTGSVCTVVMATNSTLSWLWGTNYWLERWAEASGTVAGPSGWQSSTSVVALTAVPDPHYHWAAWTGTLDGCVVTGAQLALPMDQPRRVGAVFDIDVVSLTVTSAWGSPVPSVGAHAYAYGSSATCGVEALVDEGRTQRVCVGWTGSGSIAPTGSANEVSAVMTNDSTLAWRWTNRYQLTAAALTNGNVNAASVNGFYTQGVAVSGIQATPSSGYRFNGWNGDVPTADRGANPLTVRMDQARTLTAAFVTNVAQTHYVATNGQAVWPYTNWVQAATTIQAAVAASLAGDTVLVSNGVYAAGGEAGHPSGAALVSRVALGVAITVRSMNGPGLTVIQGSGTVGTGAVRCAFVGSGARLSGFTLTNGATRASGTTTVDQSGGGVWCESESAVVSNCVIARCSANSFGGGAYGGTLEASTLAGNSAPYGGGASDGGLNACHLTNNAATYGGGAYQAALLRCTLVGNAATYGGGASESALTNCALARNAATYGGGVSGGALVNCTLAANSALYAGGGSYRAALTNSIVYYNASGLSEANVSGGSLAFCCTTPAADGEGNLAGPPRLTSLVSPRLIAGSPCLDAGTNQAWMTSAIDLAGRPRLDNGRVDIGACEYPSAGPTGALSVAASVDYTNVASGFAATFTADIRGECRGFAWTWGDGGAATGEVLVTHAYASTGTYAAILRASNLTVTAAATVTVQVAAAAVRYVSLSGSHQDPFTNWVTAATTLQAAVDAALPGDTVLATNGVYATGGMSNYPAGSALTTRIAVRKPVVVRSVNGPDVTFISGRGPRGDSAVRCAALADGAVLAGFTLTNGSTRTKGTVALDQCGGGVWCTGSGSLVSNCLVALNAATTYGGGAFRGSLADCTLAGNSASSGGGAFLGVLARCRLNGNSVSSSGGGAYGGALVSCALAGNSAYSGGGAYQGALVNATLTGNSASSGGGAYSGTLTNCIVIGNTAATSNNYYAATLAYCCTDPDPGGTGSITNDPRFADKAATNLQLLADSPCLNAGTNLAWMEDATDATGRPRIIDGTVDMGAYERGDPLRLTVEGSPARRGVARPLGYGGHWVSAGSTVTNAVGTPADETGGVRYACLGWSGTGSAPAAGATSAAVFVITNASGLTWLWTNECRLTLNASGGGTVNGGAATNWYAYGTVATGMTATPHPDYGFAGWSGDVPSGWEATNPLSVVMDRPRALVASFVRTQDWLTVESLHGQPVPGVGTWATNHGATVACSVARLVTAGPTQYVCAGWTGTGSVPPPGLSNACAFAIQTNSTIAWQWTTNHWLETWAEGSGAVSPASAWFAATSAVTLTATPAAHYHLAAWTGTLDGCVVSGLQLTAAMGTPRRLAAQFAIDTFTLAVSSARGSPEPPVGSRTNGYGSAVACSVESPVDVGRTQYVCLGWTGTGSVPPSGTSNAVTVTLTNDSTLTWLWTTRYWLEAAAATHGSVNAAAVNGFYTQNVEVAGIQATPNPGYRFAGWSGDVPAEAVGHNPLTVRMDQPRSVTAGFMTNVPLAHYVSPAGAHLWPFTNWASAATTLQAAADASLDNDSIWVTNGTYASGGASNSPAGSAVSNRIALVRAVAVRSVNGPGVTVIQGQGPVGTGAVRCAFVGRGASLAGFTLTGGATRADGDAQTNQSGGGVWCAGTDAVVSNCVLRGNSANAGGGGSLDGLLVNCELTGNSAARGGGARLGVLINCTLAGNSASERAGGASEATLTNSILFLNTAGAWDNYYAATLAWCRAEPGAAGAGNITNVPRFADAGGGDYRLDADSPCINAGTNLPGMGAAQDLDGAPRIFGFGRCRVDIGAYEYPESVSRIPTNWLAGWGLAIDGSDDASNADSDPHSNWQEWRAGTDPKDGASHLALTSAVWKAAYTGFVVSWPSVTGRTYRLGASTNLNADPFTSTVRSNIAAVPPSNTETDLTTSTRSPRFYRIEVE